MLKVSRPSLAASRRYKVLVLGSAGCGKTAAIQQALRVGGAAGSIDSAVPTLGCELFLKEETFNHESTSLSIWDCSGSERYRPTLQQLYSGGGDPPVHGAVLMYDMSNERSFEELQYWHNEIMRCCPSASLLIVGTKSDLLEQIAISADDGSRQANEWGCTHLTVSAKTGVNVDGMFALMLAVIKKKTQA